MPVTFGTVQLVPAAASPQVPGSAPPAPAPGAQAEATDPRDLGPVLRLVHARAARVRAH